MSASDAGRLAAALAAILLAFTPAPGGAGNEGEELIGRRAPAWEIAEWVQGGPLALDQLEGKVVLVRWWTGPECPYCGASAPRLNSWHQTYGPRGLSVIGLYHHKSSEPFTRAQVESLARRFGFGFAVGVDRDWITLKRWWLDGHDRAFTSVSFLLDREGIIRYVHPGGAYSKDEAARIESEIRRLLGGG